MEERKEKGYNLSPGAQQDFQIQIRQSQRIQMSPLLHWGHMFWLKVRLTTWTKM